MRSMWFFSSIFWFLITFSRSLVRLLWHQDGTRSPFFFFFLFF
jgi:hypothetical protein